jgi:hypothetical protein
MIVMFATPLVIAAIGAAISLGGPPEPTVSVAAPAGYQPITDAYFGYVIPKSWSQNDSATTDTGIYYYQGPGGWVGETLGNRSTPPTLGEAGPPSLGVFGTATAQPFQLTGGHPVTVPGTTMAYAYTLVRDGTPTASVIDAWASGSTTELWFAVHADPATTSTVVGSLRA